MYNMNEFIITPVFYQYFIMILPFFLQYYYFSLFEGNEKKIVSKMQFLNNNFTILNAGNKVNGTMKLVQINYFQGLLLFKFLKQWYYAFKI